MSQSLNIFSSAVKVRNMNAYDRLRLKDGTLAISLPPHELHVRMTALNIPGTTPTMGRMDMLEVLAAHIEKITTINWDADPNKKEPQ